MTIETFFVNASLVSQRALISTRESPHIFVIIPTTMLENLKRASKIFVKIDPNNFRRTLGGNTTTTKVNITGLICLTNLSKLLQKVMFVTNCRKIS